MIDAASERVTARVGECAGRRELRARGHALRQRGILRVEAHAVGLDLVAVRWAIEGHHGWCVDGRLARGLTTRGQYQDRAGY